MSTKINEINSLLGSALNKANITGVVDQTFETKISYLASQLSTLGVSVGSVKGGFQSLTQEVDDDPNNTPAAAGGIAMLVQDPPGLTIKKPVSASNNDLQAITEETIDGGFLNIDVTAATPEAITKALTRITGRPPEAILPAIRDISPDVANIANQLPNSIKNFTGGLASITNSLNQTLTNLQTTVTSQLSGGITEAIGNLATELAGDASQIGSFVKPIGVTGAIDPVTADYTFINSQLEVISLLTSIERTVTELIVGTTDTFKDQDVRSSNNTSGWHFIITRSGELQQGLAVSEVGNYAPNHNINTIGLAFAGGLGATFTEGQSSGKENLRSVRSLTREQYNTFDKFLKAFFAVYPYGQVLGLSNIPNTDTSSPGFDVPEYVYKRFDKINVVDVTKPAPTLNELQIQMALAARKSSETGIEDEPSEG